LSATYQNENEYSWQKVFLQQPSNIMKSHETTSPIILEIPALASAFLCF